MTTKTLVLGLKNTIILIFMKKMKDESAAFYNNNGHWIDINIDYCTKDAHLFQRCLSRVQFSIWYGIFSNM